MEGGSFNCMALCLPDSATKVSISALAGLRVSNGSNWLRLKFNVEINFCSVPNTCYEGTSPLRLIVSLVAIIDILRIILFDSLLFSY